MRFLRLQRPGKAPNHGAIPKLLGLFKNRRIHRDDLVLFAFERVPHVFECALHLELVQIAPRFNAKLPARAGMTCGMKVF